MILNKKVVVITGPTASGKTGLAIKIAKKIGGEIISADSRAIYKGIDIASAKPTHKECEGIKHWGFDLVEPGSRFTAADFKDYTYTKIKEIISKDKIPIIVGGTGLYIDSIIFNYSFGNDADYDLRKEFSQKTEQEIITYMNENNISIPNNYHNKRYLIRQIERNDNNTQSSKKNNKYSFLVVGITTDKSVLRDRIDQRAEQFFSSGVIEEAKRLSIKYGWDSEAMTANAYRLIRKYLNGELELSEIIERYKIMDWHLAKRQMTFMKRNKEIVWLNLKDAEQYILKNLLS